MTGSDPPSVVSTSTHVRIVTKYAFLNYFRARRFYVMLGIVLVISGLLTAAVGYYRPAFFISSTGGILRFFSSWWGSFVNFVVILSAAFFGGDAISSEFQNRTGYFLLPNPIRRSAVYVGKYIAALAASTLILGVFALIAVVNAVYYFPASGIPGEFGASLAFAWVYMVAALALTFMFSSMFKSSSISVLMSVILLLFVFNVVDVIAGIVAGVEPWFSITYAEGIVGNVLTVPYPSRNPTIPGPGGGFSLSPYVVTIPEGLAIIGAYFVITGALGLLFFEKKEFT